MASRMGDLAALDQYQQISDSEGYGRLMDEQQGRDPSEAWGPDGMNPQDRDWRGASLDQMPNYALDKPSRLEMYNNYYGPYGANGIPFIPSQYSDPSPFKGRRT